MIGMPPPASLNSPGVMSTAELATSVQLAKSALPKTVSHPDIQCFSVDAKSFHFRQCIDPVAYGVCA